LLNSLAQSWQLIPLMAAIACVKEETYVVFFLKGVEGV